MGAVSRDGSLAVTTGDLFHALWRLKPDGLERLARVYFDKFALLNSLPSGVDITADNRMVALAFGAGVRILETQALPKVTWKRGWGPPKEPAGSEATPIGAGSIHPPR